MKLFAIMCVRNEAYFLPTFLKHIREYVDGFMVLDDGPTDSTLEILKNENKVMNLIELPITNKLDWDEANNRRLLLESVYARTDEKDNTWVLCCDPDERFEIKFLKRMRKLCKKDDKKCYGLHFREIHDNKRYYRCDGVWDEKKKYVLFPLKKV